MYVTIEELWRYPVKSMQGERLDACRVDAAGLDGDRRYGLVTPEGYVLSGKSEPRVLLGAARTRADGEIELDLPHGVRTASDDPDVDTLLSAWLDRPVRLHRSGAKEQFLIHHQLLIDDPSVTKDFPTPPGAYFDSRSTLHLLSRASLRAAAASYPGGEWDVRRFRPNIVVSFAGDEPGFAEARWIGGTVALGGVEAVVRKATERCVLTTRAQPGLKRDLDIYRTIAKLNDTNLGIYLIARTEGSLAVGDRVEGVER